MAAAAAGAGTSLRGMRSVIMKKILAILLVFAMLLLASCAAAPGSAEDPTGPATTQATTTTAEAATTQPAPAETFETPNGLVWRVLPALLPDFSNSRIQYCGNCGEFSFGDGSSIIDPITGQPTDRIYHGGHGLGGGRFWIDPDQGIIGFGEQTDSYSGLSIFTLDEQRSWLRSSGLQLVERVDFSMHTYEMFHGTHLIRIPEEAFSGTFAVIQDNVLITDFLFDGGGFGRNVVSVHIDGDWGMVNSSGEIVIPLMYQHIFHSNDNTAFALYNDDYRILDLHSGQIIPPIFEHLFRIDDQTAFARYNGHYGILDIALTAANFS
jgi:hypothetical protein